MAILEIVRNRQMKQEPVLSYTLFVVAINTGIAMAQSLGLISLTDQQYASVTVFVSAMTILLAAVIRQYVTPLVNPRDDDGEPLTRSDNSPTIKAQAENG